LVAVFAILDLPPGSLYLIEMSQKGGYSVLLEKKGRGRGLTLSRPWAVRTFKLIKQEFHYYDGKTLKGTINTAGSTTKSVPSKLADNKEYPFAIETFDGETVLLSASSDRIRYKCMDVLNRSAVNPDWDNPDDNERGAIQQRLRELEVEKLDTAKEEAAMAFGNAGAEASLQKARTAGNAQKGAMVRIINSTHLSLISMILVVLGKKENLIFLVLTSFPLFYPPHHCTEG